MSIFLKIRAIILFLAISIAGTSGLVHGESPTKFLQSLDEASLINLEFSCLSESVNKKSCTFEVWAPFRATGERNGNVSSNIGHGIELVINGQRHKVQYRHLSSEEAYSTRLSIDTRTAADVEVQFYGHTIGKYSVTEQAVMPLMEPKQVSRFDLRKISEEGKKYLHFQNGIPDKSVYSPIKGPLGNHHLEEWIKTPTFVSSRPTETTSSVDLHTHLTGALKTEDLIAIAEKMKVPYPVSLLEKADLDYKKEAVFEKDGLKLIPFSRENISFAKYHGGMDWYWTSLYDNLDISPLHSVPFEKMSEVYNFRSPILKDIRTFPLVLEALASDYAKNGVKYAELSFYTIVQPEWLAEANRLVPELEKKYGVKLRFLVGMWRHSDAKVNTQVISETREAMKKSPYIVGVDFMGHETNPTVDFKEALADVSKLKTEFPKMAIRVHAGENPLHPNNISDAIRMGANRIGHGIYGVTDEVVALAKKNNVIIEFNFNSNLALQNVEGLQELKRSIDRYLKAGVRMTFGTDGHGIYHTSPQSEEAVARALGLTSEQLRIAKQSDEQYVRLMESDFHERVKSLSKTTNLSTKNLNNCSTFFSKIRP